MEKNKIIYCRTCGSEELVPKGNYFTRIWTCQKCGTLWANPHKKIINITKDLKKCNPSRRDSKLEIINVGR